MVAPTRPITTPPATFRDINFHPRIRVDSVSRYAPAAAANSPQTSIQGHAARLVIMLIQGPRVWIISIYWSKIGKSLTFEKRMLPVFCGNLDPKGMLGTSHITRVVQACGCGVSDVAPRLRLAGSVGRCGTFRRALLLLRHGRSRLLPPASPRQWSRRRCRFVHELLRLRGVLTRQRRTRRRQAGRQLRHAWPQPLRHVCRSNVPCLPCC